jgi:hypothetical protein
VSTITAEPARPSAPAGAGSRPRLSTLYRRLFLAYAAILAAAAIVPIFAPVTISVPVSASQLIGILAGFALMPAIFHLLCIG